MKSSRANSFLNVFILFVFLATLLGSAWTVTPARAASLVVTKASDTNDGICDSDCSLREAIILANANGVGSETITFAADYTITLGSSLPDVVTAIVINGNDPTKTIIQASTCNPVTLPGGCAPATYRVFTVTGNEGNLTLDNLTVRHGRCNGCDGGGIYNDSTLTVTNSNFTANSAYRGGGIFNTASLAETVSVTDSDFSSNSAYGGGGGIYNEGSLNITNSAISANSSNYGAGLNNSYGLLTVTNCSLSSNQAVYFGGGILTSFGSLTVENSAFSDNFAGEQGGGIYNYDSSVTISITDSSFLSNDADYGGGIYNKSGAGVLNLATSSFSGNTASASGGGIYNDDGGLIVTNSAFSGNTAAVVGGGIINYSTLTLTNNTFSGNSAVYGGGAIFNAAGLYLKNTILANSVGSGDCYNTSGDTIAANTNSLIETNGPLGNRCGTPAVTADPGLGPLANNGGATQTFAITATSSAYDAGNNTICAAAPVNNTSQNGIPRPQGAQCDIGSYEANGIATLRSNAAYDGWILESTETSAAGGSMNATATTFNLGDNAANKQYRALLSFNTAALPDNAVIIKATLRIKKQGLIGTNPFTLLGGLKVDMKKPYFGAAPGLAIGDFQSAAGKTAVATFNATPINDWYRAILNLTGRNYINKLGTTQFRLRFTTDDDNDGAADYMKFYSGDFATVSARPTLVIEYYVP